MKELYHLKKYLTFGLSDGRMIKYNAEIPDQALWLKWMFTNKAISNTLLSKNQEKNVKYRTYWENIMAISLFLVY